MNGKKLPADRLDELFDEGADEIDSYLNWGKAVRINQPAKRVNVDFPQWMVARLDREAARRGVTRQALIKMWLADRLDAAA